MRPYPPSPDLPRLTIHSRYTVFNNFRALPGQLGMDDIDKCVGAYMFFPF